MTDAASEDVQGNELPFRQQWTYVMYLVGFFLFAIGITLFLATSMAYITNTYAFWRSVFNHGASTADYAGVLTLINFFKMMGLILALFSIGLVAYSTLGARSHEHGQKGLGLALVFGGLIFSLFFLGLHLVCGSEITESNLAIAILGEIMFTLGIVLFLAGTFYIIKVDDLNERDV
jgi:hypothetical protein